MTSVLNGEWFSEHPYNHFGNPATIKIYCHNLWDARIEEDSFYAPIESISDYNWEEIGENYFLYTDIWNIMCDSLFAPLSGK